VNPAVYLMRHGRAEEVEQDRMRDPEDPLIPAGREDVRRGAEKLKDKGIGSIVSWACRAPCNRLRWRGRN
jgi:phosphohistidine phosphatase SixA